MLGYPQVLKLVNGALTAAERNGYNPERMTLDELVTDMMVQEPELEDVPRSTLELAVRRIRRERNINETPQPLPRSRRRP